MVRMPSQLDAHGEIQVVSEFDIVGEALEEYLVAFKRVGQEAVSDMETAEKAHQCYKEVQTMETLVKKLSTL